jgi:hypothetical protein
LEQEPDGATVPFTANGDGGLLPVAGRRYLSGVSQETLLEALRNAKLAE